MSKKTLEELRETIERSVDDINKSYSHVLISIALREIAKKFGKRSANKAIYDYYLEESGWSKQ